MCNWTTALHICGIRLGEVSREFCNYNLEKVAVAIHPANNPPSQAVWNYVAQLDRQCGRATGHRDRTIIFPGCEACMTVAAHYGLDPQRYPVPEGWSWNGQ